jgi:hypothetical protein
MAVPLLIDMHLFLCHRTNNASVATTVTLEFILGRQPCQTDASFFFGPKLAEVGSCFIEADFISSAAVIWFIELQSAIFSETYLADVEMLWWKISCFIAATRAAIFFSFVSQDMPVCFPPLLFQLTQTGS